MAKRVEWWSHWGRVSFNAHMKGIRDTTYLSCWKQGKCSWGYDKGHFGLTNNFYCPALMYRDFLDEMIDEEKE